MSPRRELVLALFLVLAASGRFAAAGEAWRNLRLAGGAGGEVWAAYQAFDPEGGDSFELRRFLPDSRTWERGGRYLGVLAGMAYGDGALWIATRDGALVRHGDEDNPAALADGRRRILDLVWCDGRPTALDHGDGRFRLIHPGGDGEWSDSGHDLALDPAVRLARLATLPDGLHLVWAPEREDLSGGALRHLVRENRVWREAAPLPIGDASAFAPYAAGGGLRLAAATPDPLARDLPVRLSGFAWRDDAWSPFPAETFPGALRDGADFTVFEADDGTMHWLTAESGRVAAYAPGGDGRMEKTVLDAGPGTDLAWSKTMLLLLSGLLLLFILHQARRSRKLAMAAPGRPADLVGRSAAALVDSILASVGVAAYHAAAGDLNIIGEFLSAATLNRAFWINLGGLAFFMFVMEAWLGCTPGKWLMGLRVRSAGGGPAGFRQVLVRNLARSVDMFPLVFPGIVGAFAALLNPRRQRLGDMLAGTAVLRHCPIEKRAVILASASPRRRELLEALGLSFRSAPADIDEGAVRGATPGETAMLLAEAKARRAVEAGGGGGNEIVIAADTMVVVDGEVLGKPKDAGDAKRMLALLSGRSHAVVSGVTVYDGATGQAVSDVDVTDVEFRELSEAEMDAYVASGDPMDKAGAYGIQSGRLVKQVRGSLSNVAGLPMETLRGLLELLDG